MLFLELSFYRRSFKCRDAGRRPRKATNRMMTSAFVMDM